MALRTVQPTTAEEQWSQVTSLAGMLLPITPVRRADLLTLVSTLPVTGEPLEYLNRKIELLAEKPSGKTGASFIIMSQSI